MKSIYDEWDTWQKLLDMLENQFGERSEIILHDLTKDYNHSIVDIRNGYITNRKIGGCGSNLGLEVLRGTIQNGDRYNYIVNTRDGKLLRSSTMYLHDDDGKVIGSLCINTDITETVQFENYLHRYNKYDIPVPNDHPYTPSASEPQPREAETANADNIEFFANDVTQILDYLIQQAQKRIGKPVNQMKREDKIAFIRYLDQKGAFLISKSSEKVYEYLKISRFTLYNYLDAIRNPAQEAEE